MNKSLEILLNKLGISKNQLGSSTGAEWFAKGEIIKSFSPVDGQEIGQIQTSNFEDYEKVLQTAEQTFVYFRTIPAPKRGELVRQFGNALRDKKKTSGSIGFMGNGKIITRRFG